MRPVDDQVAIHLVGEVRLVHEGEIVRPREVGGTRCAEVLAYLAIRRDREVTVDELAGVVWPAGPPQSWHSGLRGILSKVREAATLAGFPPGTVRSRAGDVRLLLPVGLTTDIEHAERLCATHDLDPDAAVSAGRSAVELLEGPVLVGIVAGWADDVRDRCAALRCRALEMQAEGSLQSGRPDRAATLAESLLTTDPLRENGYRVLMRAYVALGDRGRALDTANRCRQVLSRELGVTPSADTEALYLDILRSDDESPRRSSEAGAHSRGDELIERQEELRVVADAIDRAANGEGRFVVISGEAGTGKTTVVVEAMRRAHRRGTRVLFGRCSEEAIVSFEPFVEAVTRELRSVDATDAQTWTATHGTGILRLAPGAARRFGASAQPVGVADDRAELMTSVLEWVAATGDRGPTLLVIDDIHWASAATLAIIRYVVGAVSDKRLCVIATVREEFADRTDIRDVVLAATHPDVVTRLRLGALSVAEVAALVAAAEADLDPTELHSRTNGLPLFVTSLIAAHIDRTDSDLPGSIADSVAQRVQRLDAESRELLQLCAVIGMVAPRAVLRSIAHDLDDLHFAEAIDELARNRLVVASESGDDVILRHPLVHDAVYDDIGDARRSELHSRVARAFEAQGTGTDPDEFARLAYHFGRGVDADRPRATECFWRAGDSALAVGAHEDAVTLYSAAADRLTPPGDSATRCRLLVSLGRAQRKARDPAFRPTLFEAAAMAHRLDDLDLQVSATLANDRQGILYAQIVVDPERISSLREAISAWERSGRSDDASTARLLAQLSIELLWAAHHLTRRDLIVRGLAAARAADDTDALVDVLAAALVAATHRDLAALHHSCYDELVDLVAGSHTRALDPLRLVWFARGHIRFGHLPEATRTLARITLAQQARDPELAWLRTVTDFNVDVAAGRLARCEPVLEELRAIPASPTDTYSYGRLLAPLFNLRVLRGDLREITDAAQELEERFEIVGFYRIMLATAFADTGDHAAAADLVAWHTTERIDAIADDPLWMCSMAILGRVAAQVGDTAVCADVYRRLAPYAEETISVGGVVLGVVHHHLAHTAVALGDHDRAAAHLDGAFGAHSARGYLGWYAETAYVAVLLELSRDGRVGEKTLARARRCAVDTGATAVARRIESVTAPAR